MDLNSGLVVTWRQRLLFSSGMILALYTLTLFISASLLFGVQPLFAKMVLPKLGGSPTVWSIALVFFQSVLLLGYAYAHFIIAKLKMNHGIILHFCVLGFALLCLPIAYPLGWDEIPQSGVPFWLIGLFAVGVGFPFFAVSANAPLLQAWFSNTGHEQSKDPYFLYSASNIGSLLALLCYPFILEPLLPLGVQSMIWTGGYYLLCLFVVACGAVVWLLGQADFPLNKKAIETPLNEKPTWHQRGVWIGLAAVPSGLLVGVTAYISTDLVSAPFLWVIPLALFLVTFIITFARKPLIGHSTILFCHSLLVALALVFMFRAISGIYILSVHLAAFFICAMVCHGELVKRRPNAENLTEFYLWMSFGGVLGGLFASIIAPNIFDRVFEYPILMFAVFMCRSDFWEQLHESSWRQSWGILLAGILLGLSYFDFSRPVIEMLVLPTTLLLVIGIVLMNKKTVVQSGLVGIGLVLALCFGLSQHSIFTVRSFFGVNSVISYEDGKYNLLVHGTTIHGAEKRKNDDGRHIQSKPIPLTYYHYDTPLATVITKLRDTKGGLLGNVAVVGLGSGGMACHSQSGEKWRYFEIDPEVVKIARNPDYFNFLATCGEIDNVVIGDGRVMLEKESDHKFDVIVLDAFSSDSIPVHLMTSEAMAIYFQKLKPGGVLVFHIANRYMELGSVVSSTAANHGGVTYINKLTKGLWRVNKNSFIFESLVAVVARDPKDLGTITKSERWFQLEQDLFSKPWTDDYSNILGALFRAYFYGIVPKEYRLKNEKNKQGNRAN